MNVLTKDELWKCFLRKEPTRKERKRRYLYHGFLYWLIMCQRYPRQALAEFVALLLIFGLMFGLLWVNEIAAWLERVWR